MQCKQAEGFSLLHCSTYVTSGLKSSNPTNAQKGKSENIICFTPRTYCQRVTVSLLHFLLLWVLFCNAFFSHQNKELQRKKGPLGPARLSPGGLAFHNKCFSAVHFSTMFPSLKNLSPTRFHAICFDGVI